MALCSYGCSLQDFVEVLWAMAETSRVRPEVFDSPCPAAAAKVQDFNAQDFVDESGAREPA